MSLWKEGSSSLVTVLFIESMSPVSGRGRQHPAIYFEGLLSSTIESWAEGRSLGFSKEQIARTASHS